MAHDHDEEGADVLPFKLKGGTVEVHELGSGQQVDRPDVAAKGMNAFKAALGSAGIEIVGPVAFNRPGESGEADDAILEALNFEPDPDDHAPD